MPRFTARYFSTQFHAVQKEWTPFTPLEQCVCRSGTSPWTHPDLANHRPDGKRYGYFYGYRAWALSPNGLLESANTSFWPVGRGLGALDGPDAHAPGVFAWKNEEQLAQMAEDIHAVYFPKIVFGRVALWGSVLECQNGYVAEWAYPDVLYHTRFIEPESTAVLYGVKVEDAPATLIYAIKQAYRRTLYPTEYRERRMNQMNPGPPPQLQVRNWILPTWITTSNPIKPPDDTN